MLETLLLVVLVEILSAVDLSTMLFKLEDTPLFKLELGSTRDFVPKPLGM